MLHRGPARTEVPGPGRSGDVLSQTMHREDQGLLSSLIQSPRWVPRIASGFIDVSDDDCTCTDHHVVTDRNRQYCCVGSDGNSIPHSCRLPLAPITSRGSLTKPIIDEHHAVSDHTTISNLHVFAHQGVGLDQTTFANRHAALYFGERSDERSISDSATVEIHRLHDGYVVAKHNVADSDASEMGTAHFGTHNPIARRQSTLRLRRSPDRQQRSIATWLPPSFMISSVTSRPFLQQI